MSSEHDHQVLIQYLIGSLPEAEAERLDQLSIADDEFVSRLSAAENDLVDAYVRGELSGDTLQRFGVHYLSSQSRRDKVAFANTLRLREIREATRPAESVAPGPPWRFAAWRLRTVPGPAPAWALAGVAALTLVAAGYLLVANGRLQQELARTQSDRASLQSRARDLQRRLVRERPADAGAPKEADGSGRPQAQTEPLRIASLFLAPPTRGLSRVQSLTVPPATDAVALRLQLENDEFPRYRVALKAAASDRVLWRSEKLESVLEGGRRVVSVRVPAALLTPRHYSAELTGITPGGAAELLGTYSFAVVR
jgi:hypothetical protein